jgi:hypothetical protein
MGLLAVLMFLLAPWGGPCDRRCRPADPTTSRLAGPSGTPRPAARDADAASDLEVDPALLEEEDGDGSETEVASGSMIPPMPTSSASPGARDRGRHRDRSGRATRPALLRC